MQEMWELASTVDPSSRRYTVHSQNHQNAHNAGTDDLHAWSIYRQNLNSDFTDSALGSEERSPLPYGNFQLREQTVQSILRHPRLAPRSELANNMYAYLKFGLPRVFPPGGASSKKDTASEIHALDSVSVANANKVSRARSETDLINGGQNAQHIPGLIANRFRKPAHDRGHGHGPQGQSNGHMRAHSESNLLLQESTGGFGGMQRPISKAGSQASLVSRNSRPRTAQGHLNRSYHHADEGDDGRSVMFEYPHLQVRNLSFESRKSKGSNTPRLLDGISFDLVGGESLAILATNGSEATTLLDILAARHAGKGKVSGEFLLNGNPVSIERLGSRVAYVRKDYRLHRSLTVEQTLSFHFHLRSKDLSTSYLSTKISVLLEELGLGAVRTSLVSTLTSSERQRLVVACQLITGAEILCLDDATAGMDIFDTFFLVEYLRGWANSDTGRILIMSIHPPTYEIFSMFTKVALMSTGRLMFYGHRKEMLPYFAFIEYPCPAFKNPSDYYLDLVTLDNLSSEALLESSQRIETLADSYRRKQELFPDPSGPPQPLPPRIKSAGFLRQFWTLLVSWIGYKFPWNIVDWMFLLLLATGLSITVGTLFWNIRLTVIQDQNNLSDRLGFHWVLITLLTLPVIVMLSSEDCKDLDCVARDFEERLYSKGVYFLAKNLVEIPHCATIALGYIIPAYLMAGLHQGQDVTTFYIYIGYFLLYIYTLRLVFQGLTYLFRSGNAALTAFFLLFFTTSMAGYYTVHPTDLGEWVDWLRHLSPEALIYQRVLQDELSGSELSFSCPRHPVIQDANTPIVTQLECRLSNGAKALEYFGLSQSTGPLLIQLLTLGGIGFIFYLVGFFSFILRRQGVAVPTMESP